MYFMVYKYKLTILYSMLFSIVNSTSKSYHYIRIIQENRKEKHKISKPQMLFFLIILTEQIFLKKIKVCNLSKVLILNLSLILHILKKRTCRGFLRESIIHILVHFLAKRGWGRERGEGRKRHTSNCL